MSFIRLTQLIEVGEEEWVSHAILGFTEVWPLFGWKQGFPFGRPGGCQHLMMQNVENKSDVECRRSGRIVLRCPSYIGKDLGWLAELRSRCQCCRC